MQEAEVTLTPEAEAKKLRMEGLKQKLLEQTNDYQIITSEQQAKDVKLEKLQTWLIDGSGVYCAVKNRVGEFTARISDKSPGTLPKVLKEKYKMYTPKIPRDIYLQIRSFFYDIADDMQDAEAYVELYWDTVDNKYIIHVPKQIVSKGSVRYDKEEDLFLKDFDRYIAVMQIHSHNTMEAFFSGVDDADEKETRFYGVFGRIKDPEPTFKCRFVVMSERLNIQADTIFDMAPAKVEYPAEWKDNVKKLGRQLG